MFWIFLFKNLAFPTSFTCFVCL